MLGLRRTGVAGILLVGAAAVPVLLDSGRGGASSLTLVAVPGIVAGVLYLLAAAVGDRPRNGDELTPSGRPRSGR